jgi:hypothetical protein
MLRLKVAERLPIVESSGPSLAFCAQGNSIMDNCSQDAGSHGKEVPQTELGPLASKGSHFNEDAFWTITPPQCEVDKASPRPCCAWGADNILTEVDTALRIVECTAIWNDQ